MPDDLDRVANWVEVLTGLTLDPQQGSIQLLDNAAWLASRERLEQRAGRRGRPRIPTRLPRADRPVSHGTLTSPLGEGSGTEQARVAAGDQPDPQVHDPVRAVERARRAVRLAPKSAWIWNTLGVAHYRAGDWKAAIEALERAETLAPDLYLAFNGFFLAMAHWRLDEKDEARKWYDKAVEWMDKNQPQNEELLRFRAEAEELLGLKAEETTGVRTRQSGAGGQNGLIPVAWQMKRPVGSLPPSKPPTGPAPPRRSVCALGDVVTILSQTNLERENEPCHSPVGCDTSDPPWRRANAIAGDGPRLEPRRIGQASKSWKTASCPAFLAPVELPRRREPRSRGDRATSTTTAGSTWPSANADDNTVSVLLGNGDGTFQPARTSADRHRPASRWRSATSTATASSTWRRPTTSATT